MSVYGHARALSGIISALNLVGINATIICKAISFLSGRFQSYARHLRTRLGLKGGVDPPFQILGAYSTYGRRAEERSLYRSRHLGQ